MGRIVRGLTGPTLRIIPPCLLRIPHKAGSAKGSAASVSAGGLPKNNWRSRQGSTAATWVVWSEESVTCPCATYVFWQMHLKRHPPNCSGSRRLGRKMADTTPEMLVDFLQSLPASTAGGDFCMMFAALHNRLKDPALRLDRTDRPKGNRTIQYLLLREYGIRGLPIWGPSALRGGLPDYKEHIRQFIDLVNGIPNEQTEASWDACVGWLAAKMSAECPPIEINRAGGMLGVLRELCAEKSQGVVQQCLCAAALQVWLEATEANLAMESKRTFAGDAQSGMKGDVLLLEDGEPCCVFEVKAHRVNAAKMLEVLESHGAVNYPLCIVAEGFAKDVQPFENVAFVRIVDLVQAFCVLAAVAKAEPVEDVARRVLEQYNEVVRKTEGRDDLVVAL